MGDTETPGRPPRTPGGLEEGSFALAAQFIADFAQRQPRATSGSGGTPELDWHVVSAALGEGCSVEQAIGRAIVMAASRPSDALATDGAPTAPAPTWFGSAARSTRALAQRGGAAVVLLARRSGEAAHQAVPRLQTTRGRQALLATALILATLGATIGFVGNLGGPTKAAYAQNRSLGNARSINGASVSLRGASPVANLVPATTVPAPAPPSIANQPPLKPHEVFGFAPYWTLAQSAGFNVNDISTLAYFSIDVNANGTLDESGPGWDGYESQNLSDLITRAHGAGDRVVLTVNCFDQHSLDQLTSSPTAPATLSSALLSAIETKNLDGVNLDFEGNGSADQAGLTHLVTGVSAALHAANPHYQVTMDTYASSAGDTGGFYNIAALAPAVDGFFVMEYGLNLGASQSPVSPLTSGMFSDTATIDQYDAVVAPSKVILGLPYFGVDWPTSDGTLGAQATGPATDVTYGQVMASGHKVYWDATTHTAWTSYEVGNQWHETFFEDPTSLYDAAQLADANNLAGVGIWALGMDDNDPNLLPALLGFAPAARDGLAGPTSTTPSGGTSPPTPVNVAPPTATTTTVPQSTTTSPTPPSTTTTTGPRSFDYTGTWLGQSVTLTPAAQQPSLPISTSIGQLLGFATNDPSTACLSSEASLSVWPSSASPDQFFVVTHTPGDCATTTFTFNYP